MDFDSATLLDLVVRIQSGDDAAYSELVRRAGRRPEQLVRRMLGRYPDVARWEQAEDILQGPHRRLWVALREVMPHSTRSFANLAAQLIRRELIDLARHYRGPHWVVATREGDVADRQRLRLDAAARPDRDPEFWAAYHEAVERLPDDQREAIALVLYDGLPLKDVASTLGVTVRTVQRRLALAMWRLRAAVGEGWPLRADEQ